MRSIWALSLLVALCGSANAATVHHPHRRHPASAFAYEPPGPPIHYQRAPYNDYNEPYPGRRIASRMNGGSCWLRSLALAGRLGHDSACGPWSDCVAVGLKLTTPPLERWHSPIPSGDQA
jgi:hypothetical protein